MDLTTQIGPAKGYEIFVSFLKKNDLFLRYLKNTSTHQSVINELVETTPTVYNLMNIVNRSMGWSSTSEGSTFWRTVHYKWLRFLYDKKIFKSDIILSYINKMWNPNMDSSIFLSKEKYWDFCEKRGGGINRALI